MEERETSNETNAENDATASHDSQPRYYDFNMPIIIIVGFISIVLVVVTIFFVQGLCYQWENRYIRERSTDYVNQPVKQIISDQKKMLEGVEEGVTPVAETMKQIVEEYGKK